MSIFIDGAPYHPTIFPDKTSQCWKIQEESLNRGDTCRITWLFSGESELMHIAQIVDLIKTYGRPVTLVMNYLPYARQDKDISNNSCFALRTFSKIIDSLGIDLIEVIDCHSDVFESISETPVENYFPLDQILSAISSFKPDLIVYPDKGSQEKYSERVFLARYIPHVSLEKYRDPHSGHIKDIFISESKKHFIYGKRILIIDDICDGGLTFEMSCDFLKRLGSSDVGIYVSHGIFSKGKDRLINAGISKIYTISGDKTP